VNRLYTGLWALLLVGVGLVFAWYATQAKDAADGSAVERSEPKQQVKPQTEPEKAVFPGNGYEVAQVKQGQTVEILDEPGGQVVAEIGDESELFGSPRVFPVLEPGPTWLGVTAPELGNGVIGWLRYDPEKLLLGDTRISIRIDLSESKLTLLRDDEVLQESVVTVGRAGNETPTGRFAITDTITENLDPVYGSGAVVTSARQGSLAAGWNGGNMIAMHGWAGPVGGADSGGCLRMNNEDVLGLIRTVALGAPVFISA
jgi:lipoprotein-anchoring transpeptidase ErfK/SrfK